MMTLKEKYEEEKMEILRDAEVIETATDWSSCLMYGSGFDTSDRANKRMEWVERAISSYVKQHKKEILTLAAQMCRDSIGE